MYPDLRPYTSAIWMTIAAIWLLSSLSTKRTAAGEPARYDILRLVLLACAYILIFSPALDHQNLLRWQPLPSASALAYLGLALTLAGAILALWARFFIGRNWSSRITLKQNHQLIKTGPYRFVRHPIYAGFVLGFLGTAIATNRLHAYIGFVLTAIVWHFKAAAEEKLMTATFGSEYLEYKRHTKALIPFLF